MTAPDGVGVFLDGVKERVAGITAGPWFVDRGGDFHEPFWQIPDVLRDRYGNNSISSADRDTIEFIAAARTDVERLAGAVEAVLALHQPEHFDSKLRRWTTGDARPGRTLCEACSGADWPCATVRAVAAHLAPGATT